MNTHTTIEELLGASFSEWSVLYQRKVGDYQNFLFLYKELCMRQVTVWVLYEVKGVSEQ
jgi:hypothetical protein